MKHPIQDARDRDLLRQANVVIGNLLGVVSTNNQRTLDRARGLMAELEQALYDRPTTPRWVKLWRKTKFKLTYFYPKVEHDPDWAGDVFPVPRITARFFWHLFPGRRPSNLVSNPSMERDSNGWSSLPLPQIVGVLDKEGDASATNLVPRNRWHHVNISASLMVEGDNSPSQQELLALLFDPRMKKLMHVDDAPEDIGNTYVDHIFASAQGPQYFGGVSEGATWSK